ncbi:hypothetical protein OQA88_3511 [Cercophora sp. LCS_1]
MPTLVAVDVSVTDDRISLVFSHRAIAQAYAKHMEYEDRRPQQAQPAPSYRRNAHFNPSTKEVTLALPSFINWFITCRLPDDEDSITFTFMDNDEASATRWADSMVLFERVLTPVYDESVKQLHVRRLWNKSHLLKRLEDLRKTASPRRGPTPVSAAVNGQRPAGPRQAQNMWW